MLFFLLFSTVNAIQIMRFESTNVKIKMGLRWGNGWGGFLVWLMFLPYSLSTIAQE